VATVTLKNTTATTWRSSGNAAVFLSYHVYASGGPLLVWDGVRSALPYDVAPGQSVTVTASLRATAGAGDRVFAWDLVQEGVEWLSSRGIATIPLVWSPVAGTRYDKFRSPRPEWFVETVRQVADIRLEHGFVVAEAPRGLHGAAITLDYPSVGATENLMMAAVAARGTTVIDNAAREPEIADTADLLVKMGARIAGAGTSTIEIEGVEGFTPAEHRTVADRIETGTWACAAVATRGDVTIAGCRPDHLELLLSKLADAGARIDLVEDGLRVRQDDRARATDFVTLPYPGVATDFQPILMAALAVADGTSIATENVFESRFLYVDELRRMGADIRTEGHHAVIRGVERLSAAPVRALDIRAGAAMVIAALCADGVTEIADVHHIDRGYADLEAKLSALGAEVS
jgi:UDP-N-acetylglucosamine 1-carboxyvinyltransferase